MKECFSVVSAYVDPDMLIRRINEDSSEGDILHETIVAAMAYERAQGLTDEFPIAVYRVTVERINQ